MAVVSGAKEEKDQRRLPDLHCPKLIIYIFFIFQIISALDILGVLTLVIDVRGSLLRMLDSARVDYFPNDRKCYHKWVCAPNC